MGTRISDLTQLSSAADDDQIPIVDTSAATTKYIEKSDLITSSGVLQMVVGSSTTAGTTTNQIPMDGTKPQNTEGAEVVTATITPTSAASTLLILVRIAGYGAKPSTVALFQDSTADTISCVFIAEKAIPGLTYKMTSGTTAATTFKARFGPRDSGETCYYNRSQLTASPYGSGMMMSTITIWEY